MCKLRKFSLLLTFILLFSIVLTSCGNPADTTTPPPEEGKVPTEDGDKAGETDEKEDKGTPIAASGTFTTSDYFDPPPSIHGNVWAPPGIGGMSEYVFDRLFEYAPFPSPEYIPMLGESFEEDGNKTIIHLKKDVKWSDGKPFTSKDVICTFNLGLLAGWPMWKYADTVEAPDEYTVVVNWKQAGPVLTTMAITSVINGPYHIYGKWADELAPLTAKRDDQGNLEKDAEDAVGKIREDLYKFKPNVTEIVGTGPFKINNVTASEAILNRNESSWCADNVKINNVKVQRYVSIEAYLSMVMSDGYDMEPHGCTPDVFKQVEKNNPKMKVIWGPDLGQPSMQFNISKYPVNNPKVRKAIMHAIDRKGLLPILEPGTEEPDMYATGMIPMMRQAWLSDDFLSSLEEYDYNPSKAEELLNEVGWKKGSDGFWHDDKGKIVQLEIASMNSWPIFFIGGDAITNQLNEFGLKTEFKAMELSAYWKYLDNGEAMISFDFRPGSPAYGHPWEVYRNIYIDGGIRLGFKDPKDAGNPKIDIELSSGEKIDPLKLIDDLFYTMEKGDQIKIVEQLAKATNELAATMPIGEKYVPHKIFNEKLTGYPDDREDPLWYGYGMRTYGKLIRNGSLYFEE